MSANRGKVYRNLLTNEDFRDWVLHPSNERDAYWNKWIEIHQESIAEVEEAKRSIQSFQFKEDLLSDAQLDEILSKVISDDENNFRAIDSTHVKQGNNRWLGIAASISVLIVTVAVLLITDTLSFDFDDRSIQTKTIFNPPGQRSRIKLPDGTMVNLNSNSTISFPETFAEGRRVHLDGEAYFDVISNPSNPFRIESNDLKLMVYGTSFNVKSFSKDSTLEVALVEGKVNISKLGHASENIALSPGEKLHFNKSSNKYEKSSFDIAVVTAWKNGTLVLKDESFNTFINKLESWYGVTISIENSPNVDWKVNGNFQDEPLEEVLMGIQFTYGVDYKINDKKVSLVIPDN